MKWFRVVGPPYLDPDIGEEMFPGIRGTEIEVLGWVWGDAMLWAVFVLDNGRPAAYPGWGLEAVRDGVKAP